MGELDYPNRTNTQGFPALLGTPSVDTASGNLVISFNPHRALNENWAGGFYVEIAGPIVTGAQPVVFATRGIAGTTPLYFFSGVQVTAADLVTTTGGVLHCFYNSNTGRLQLVGIATPTA